MDPFANFCCYLSNDDNPGWVNIPFSVSISSLTNFEISLLLLATISSNFSNSYLLISFLLASNLIWVFLTGCDVSNGLDYMISSDFFSGFMLKGFENIDGWFVLFEDTDCSVFVGNVGIVEYESGWL